ncbi:hypothetical protein P3T76_008222 [Phytophthora citrophthora]|uniref:M96 mating-specific protein family n=1 Tax=Phytophthora citrophthora TaxID=4793 RepID=A0AAD9GJV4_9STRA|nr:hypothetical protein P3T76_008222 [Phytophthora citrophthora]
MESDLEEPPSASTQLHVPSFASGDNLWGPDLHWGLLNQDLEASRGMESSKSTLLEHFYTENTSQVATKKQRKKFNPNKARDERRFQLIELQEQVAELEFTLKRLQTFRDTRKRIEHPAKPIDGVPPVWQEICSRQAERRVKAEWKSIQLKKQYEKENELVKSFEKLLYKRRNMANDAEPEATKRTRRTDIPAGHIERMTALIFEELAAGVKMCYYNVERVFNTGRPVTVDLVKHSALLEGGDKVKGEERKFYDSKTMPFSVRATGDAWWGNWHNYRGQCFQDDAVNEVSETFGLEMNDFKTNMSATAYAQQIHQRYVEDGRVIFVWDAYVEPFGFGNEHFGEVYFLEQNYVLIEPEEWSSEKTGDSCNGWATRVSTCFVLTPYFLDPKIKDDAKTTARINFLVSALSANARALSQMFEDLLLDQALQCYSVR